MDFNAQVYILRSKQDMWQQDQKLVMIFNILQLSTTQLYSIFTFFLHFLVVEYCGISSRTVPLMMVSVDQSEASILTIDQSQVMASYTFASLTVPWLAMALSSWR